MYSALSLLMDGNNLFRTSSEDTYMDVDAIMDTFVDPSPPAEENQLSK